jgi:hypothetical protein
MKTNKAVISTVMAACVFLCNVGHQTLAGKEPAQDEIGEVYVSVVGVRPLNEVIDDLQPQFNMTAQSALQAAVPNTLNSSESTLSSLNAALKIGLMLPTSSTSAPPDATIPSQPLAPLGAPGSSSGGALSVDPISQYQAAASLFQQIKLLNRSLKDVPHFEKYVPYILTIQITLIPYKRNVPYDAYSDVTFFSDTNEPPAPPNRDSEEVPLVFPILASDELEAASDQQSLNQLRQLGFALAAAFHSVGAQAGIDQLNQKIDAINANDLNSLLTIGKISQNSVAVRLGARNQTATLDKVAMVPEIHNVTLLVLTGMDAHELEMVSRTIIRDASTGAKLPINRRPAAIDKLFIENVFGPDGYDLLSKHEMSQIHHEPYIHHLYDFEQNLINDVFDTTTNSFKNFVQSFSNYFANTNNFPPKFDTNAPVNKFKELDVVDLDSVWLDVARIGGAGSQYDTDLVPLPPWMPVFPPDDQTVLYTVDKKSTVFTLNNGERLTASKMFAKLTFTNSTATNSLYSDQVDVADNGTTLNLQFPSLLAIDTADPGLKQGTNYFRPQKLVLNFGHAGEGAFSGTNAYTSFATLPSTKADPSPPAWKIIRTYGNLVAGVTNQFSIVLATNSPEALSANWYLDVENPIVITNSPIGGVLDLRTNGIYHLQAGSISSEVTFTFAPLLTGQSVDFNLLNSEQAFVANLNHQIVFPPNSSQSSAQNSNGNKPGP